MPTTFTNQATVSYNAVTRLSNIVTGEIDTAVTASKTAIEGSYTQGNDISYVITLVNTSVQPINDITVTDNLGAYAVSPTLTVRPLTFVPDSLIWFKDGVRQNTPLTGTITDGNLVITGASISASNEGTGNTAIIYRATANNFAPIANNGQITNTATVTSTQFSTPVTATATIPADRGINLAITKSVTPTIVPENGELTYTMTIENYGSRATAAGDNLIVGDTLNPPLSNIEVSLDGQIFDPANYTYNDGVFTTVADTITVPAATYTQNPATGEFNVIPGTAILTITGNI